MRNFKGTKGKWVFDDIELYSLNKEETGLEYLICKNPVPYSDHRHIWESNALLISKAPEMLEMLEDILEQIEDGRTYITKEEIKKLIKEATEI